MITPSSPKLRKSTCYVKAQKVVHDGSHQGFGKRCGSGRFFRSGMVGPVAFSSQNEAGAFPSMQLE